MKRVTLYTDGACSGNPGVGGYGAVLINMGVNGIVATTYILLIGGDINGADGRHRGA